MGHEEPLPQCKEIQHELKHKLEVHTQESGPVRSDVERHNHQIKTLEEARLATMEDIKDIKGDLSDVKKVLEGIVPSVKTWVLGGILATIVVFSVPTLTLVYAVGQNTKQVETIQHSVVVLEDLHPRAK